MRDGTVPTVTSADARVTSSFLFTDVEGSTRRWEQFPGAMVDALQRHDALLTEIALKTKRIKIGTGIVNVFSRSPALIAMQAATIDEISGGRFILGLGTSGKRVIEGLHGRDFEKPLTQTRDVIRVVRTMLDGRPLSEADTKLR